MRKESTKNKRHNINQDDPYISPSKQNQSPSKSFIFLQHPQSQSNSNVNSIRSSNSKITLRKHKFVQDAPQTLENYKQRRKGSTSGKETQCESSREAEIKNKQSTKSARQYISVQQTESDRVQPIQDDVQYNTQRDHIKGKQKNEMQEFKEELQQNLAKLHFFIEKAEKAQDERKKSQSRHNSRAFLGRSMSPKTDVMNSPRKNDFAMFQKVQKHKSPFEKKILFTIDNTYEKQDQRNNEKISKTIDNKVYNSNNKMNFDNIDKIIEQSDNEEETRILQMLTTAKLNERYASRQQILTTEPTQEVINIIPENIQIPNQTPTFQVTRPHSHQDLFEKSLKAQDIKSQKFKTTSTELMPLTIEQFDKEKHIKEQIEDFEQRLDEINEMNQKMNQENKKLNSKSKHYQKKTMDLKCKVKMLENQLKSQDDFQRTQSNRMDLLSQDREKLISQLSVQEDQIRNLKSLLNQSLSTKIKYENIFKKLLEDEYCRNTVLSMMKA